jgi:hypothetical protein
MKRFFNIVGPLLLSIAIIQMNGGIVAQTTTNTTRKPPPPTETTVNNTGTFPEHTTVTAAPGTTAGQGVQPSTSTTRHHNKKRRRKGALAHTGPGDDAGNFRLILFNGGVALLMLGAIFFAVKRRLDHREWWRMASKM